MVKLNENSGEPDLSQSVALNNGSCSAEATQAELKLNEISLHALKVSAVNGNSTKLPVKEIPRKCEVKKCINKLPVNGTSKVNETSEVNGTSKVDKASKVDRTPNGTQYCAWKESVKDAPTVDWRSRDDYPVEVPVFNGNCGDDSPVEVPVPNGKCKDSSKAPSESGSSTISHVSDSLYNETDCDVNEEGFIEVVSKKKQNKNRPKNRRKKPSSNLPPGLNAEGVRCDKGIDKKLGEKTSSTTHLSQKPPTRNFAAIRSSAKSYSAVVANGQKNDVPKVLSDCLNVTVCPISNKSNSDLLGTKTATSDTFKVTNSPTKVEMSHALAQTDTCFQNEIPSQKECLQSCEVLHESEKSSSPIDSVEETDFGGEKTDESSNAAYCESVVSNDSGRGDSEVTYDRCMPYCCYFPRDMVKNLIGRRGRYRFEIIERTGANFWVPQDCFIDEDTTIVAFTGTGAQIERAKEIIKQRFDVPLTQYIGSQNASNGPPLSDNFSATLPVGINFLGVVSCIFAPTYFWLQQYGHPGFHPLEDLEKKMSNHFNTVVDAPGVENPIIGNVVAVPVFIEGESEKWVRGEIVHIIPESGKVIARYLDHGGESELPASVLRPMRHEFLSIPFFAAKCSLLGVLPQGDTWSEAACAEFKRLCNSSLPPLVTVIYKVPEGYFVSISGFDDEANARVDVAVTLVAKGLALFDTSIVPGSEPSNEIVH